MLVNVITRYPEPPPVVLAPTMVRSPNQFGAHAFTVLQHYLRPAAVHNDQVFGSNAVKFALKTLPQTGFANGNEFGTHAIDNLAPGARHLAPSRVVNGNLFGASQLRVSTRYLLPATIANSNRYGGPRVRLAAKLLAPTLVRNANRFGTATSVAVAEKGFSYSNPLGSGDRTASITVTTSGGSVFNSPSKLVDGNKTDNVFWGFGEITIKFDLGSPKVIRQARWIQNSGTTHNGLFQWQGSNDDAAYADIGGTFKLGGAAVSLCNTLINNSTAYRYYRLAPIAGATLSGSPYFREVEFYIEGNAKEQPDAAYTFPCGGAVDAGGQSTGTGGNDVSRTPLIAITASFTPLDGTLAKLIDGQSGFSGSKSLQIPDGLTNAVITFDFQPSGKRHIVTGIGWEQSNSTSQGNYDWDASNDNASWTTLKANFSLVNGSSSNETTWASVTPYRYHRLKQVGGVTSSAPWVHEIYFKCAPSAYGADAI